MQGGRTIACGKLSCSLRGPGTRRHLAHSREDMPTGTDGRGSYIGREGRKGWVPRRRLAMGDALQCRAARPSSYEDEQ